MLDLRNEYNFAMRKVAEWRNAYQPNEYPHKMVINMMYRAYATQVVFDWFEEDRLQSFCDFSSAAQYVLQKYADASGFVNPHLLTWLANTPNQAVGTIVYSRYEAMASRVEMSRKDKEELEFSYLFETLNDFAVLYFIAMRLSGKNEVEAISNLCGFVLADLPYLDYTMVKQIFQRFWIAKFLEDNYHPLP